MEAEEVCLEEGELSDDSDTYTPLARPTNYSAVQPNSRFPVLQDSESEPELQSSETDSDSDGIKKKRKKPKIKLKPKLEVTVKKKNYDIWSTRVQEDVLAETLNSCDVTNKDRSRTVETYDYLGHHFTRNNNKRSRDDRRNPNLRSMGRSKSEEKVKGHPRVIMDLVVEPHNTPEEIAKDMANKLSEEKEDLILKVVNTLGIDKSFQIFKETKRIEQEGGMLIMNQARRRTPGGVFLFLVRHDNDLTPEQRNKIFDEEKEKTKIFLKNKQKKKFMKLKEEIASSKAKKFLPDLLTRAELLTNENNRVRKETEERDVINPPPTPETDGGHSGDGMESNGIDTVDNGKRKIESYDDDFLDINCSNDMDLF